MLLLQQRKKNPSTTSSKKQKKQQKQKKKKKNPLIYVETPLVHLISTDSTEEEEESSSDEEFFVKLQSLRKEQQGYRYPDDDDDDEDSLKLEARNKSGDSTDKYEHQDIREPEEDHPLLVRQRDDDVSSRASSFYVGEDDDDEEQEIVFHDGGEEEILPMWPEASIASPTMEAKGTRYQVNDPTTSSGLLFDLTLDDVDNPFDFPFPKEDPPALNDQSLDPPGTFLDKYSLLDETVCYEPSTCKIKVVQGKAGTLGDISVLSMDPAIQKRRKRNRGQGEASNNTDESSAFSSEITPAESSFKDPPAGSTYSSSSGIRSHASSNRRGRKSSDRRKKNRLPRSKKDRCSCTNSRTRGDEELQIAESSSLIRSIGKESSSSSDGTLLSSNVTVVDGSLKDKEGNGRTSIERNHIASATTPIFATVTPQSSYEAMRTATRYAPRSRNAMVHATPISFTDGTEKEQVRSSKNVVSRSPKKRGTLSSYEDPPQQLYPPPFTPLLHGSGSHHTGEIVEWPQQQEDDTRDKAMKLQGNGKKCKSGVPQFWNKLLSLPVGSKRRRAEPPGKSSNKKECSVQTDGSFDDQPTTISVSSSVKSRIDFKSLFGKKNKQISSLLDNDVIEEESISFTTEGQEETTTDVALADPVSNRVFTSLLSYFKTPEKEGASLSFDGSIGSGGHFSPLSVSTATNGESSRFRVSSDVPTKQFNFLEVSESAIRSSTMDDDTKATFSKSRNDHGKKERKKHRFLNKLVQRKRRSRSSSVESVQQNHNAEGFVTPQHVPNKPDEATETARTTDTLDSINEEGVEMIAGITQLGQKAIVICNTKRHPRGRSGSTNSIY